MHLIYIYKKKPFDLDKCYCSPVPIVAALFNVSQAVGVIYAMQCS